MPHEDTAPTLARDDTFLREERDDLSGDDDGDKWAMGNVMGSSVRGGGGRLVNMVETQWEERRELTWTRGGGWRRNGLLEWEADDSLRVSLSSHPSHVVCYHERAASLERPSASWRSPRHELQSR